MRRILPLLLLLFAFAIPAHAQSPQEVVERARIAVQSVIGDPNFGYARTRLKSARGVLIMPSIVKGGFIVGGEGGYGVLLTRNAQGWSAPAFYMLAAASLGFQIGVEVKEVIFIINNERGLNALLKNQMKLGADASLALGPIGAGVEASSTGNPAADIIAFSKSQGVFGGAAFQGGVVSAQEKMNSDFYGRPLTPRQILSDAGLHNPTADALRSALAAY
jgi:lipid-binding SYLF domain-containing protein